MPPYGGNIGESNYLTESDAFEKFFNELNEEIDDKSKEVLPSGKINEKIGIVPPNTRPKNLPDTYKEDNMAKMKMNEDISPNNQWVGVDRDLENSLEEYDFVATQQSGDEWAVVYKISDDAYGVGYISESDLDSLIKGEDWADNEAVQGMLSTVGSDVNSWLGSGFINKLSDVFSYWGHENIMGTDYSPWDKQHAYSKIGIEMSDEMDEVSMLDPNEESMSFTPDPKDRQSATVPTGVQITNESFDNLLSEVENELKAFSIHHDKLKRLLEDKKPSSLVNVERLGNDNKSNFTKDLKHSGTAKTINIEKELQWKDQQEEIGKDPQKLSADIEKAALKGTEDGGALKNVGNSAGKNGEIPKRNMTKDEQATVDSYRKGIQDFTFDTPPGDEFEERMKVDMGKERYDARKDNIEAEKNMPRYNKEVQPTQATTNSKINKDLHENVLTGRYYDQKGQSHMIDFTLADVKEVKSKVINENWSSINLDGLGNAYSNKVNSVTYKLEMNEGINKVISTHKFYLTEKQQYCSY